jgi:hypothetical protein
VLSGLIAEAAGWRTVYVVAGAMVLAIAGVLNRRLPNEERRPTLTYSRALASVVHLMRTEPLLRLRAAIGGLVFATFNVIWTSLAFLLVAAPYHYGEAVIGLFGLLGAYGAGGWPAVVLLGVSFSGAGLVLWAVSELARRKGALRPGIAAVGRPASTST